MPRITKNSLQAITAGAASMTLLSGSGMAEPAHAAEPVQRPNVVLVMADDMGWGDTGFHGHPELRTPNLDAMAAAGMALNRFYAAAPVCSPTRASFLTGRHPRRMHINNANNGHLPNQEITLAEIARSLGYTTGHFGKWHLGTLTKQRNDANRGKPGHHEDYSTPWDNGFDRAFSTESKVPTYNPYEKPGEKKQGFYGTWYWTGPEQAVEDGPHMQGDDSRLLMDQTLGFIDDAHAAGRPFLAVTWFHTPHAPVVKNPDHPYDDFAHDKSLQAYYSCITAMDQEMGRLRRHLRELGIEDDTLVLFTSDNGPEHRFGKKNDSATIGPDGSAGPFRGAKTQLWEGGVRVPCIVEWPGHIRPGVSDAPAVTSDILPTLLDIWDADMPDDRPLDGVSLMPVLRGEPYERPKPIAFHYAKNRSLVENQYKLISTNNGASYKLYDLLNDPGETTDLAADQPDRVLDMKERWQRWFDETEVSRTGADYTTGVTEAQGVAVRTDKVASFEPGRLASPEPLLFVEQQYRTLGEDLAVDAGGSDTVPAGTLVHSFLLHFDPADGPGTASASVTFDEPIVGVIVQPRTLAASDFLAFGDPAFADAGRDASPDGGSGASQWSISNDGRTLNARFSAGATRMRILTAATHPASANTTRAAAGG